VIPTYQAQFAKPLVNQLIAVFQRDQAAALAVVNATRPATRPLHAFAAFHKEAAPIQNWPALVLVAQDVSFDAASDLGLRTQSIRFFCALGVTGTDPEWLADDAMDYLRVADIILSSLALSNFYQPLPVAHRTLPGGTTEGISPSAAKILDLRITRHDLGALVSRRSGALARGPQIEFVIELAEI
jgi:hypothetical protein